MRSFLKNHWRPLEGQKPLNSRYYSLDCWRGVACLMIVVLHSSFYLKYNSDAGVMGKAGEALYALVKRCGCGVQIFFVISGYCIAASVDSARRRAAPPGSFFFRRFRRIFPPFWIAVAATIVLYFALSVAQRTLLSDSGTHDTGVIPNPSTLLPAQWFGNLTLTEYWRYHLFGPSARLILGPSWSLCYEEQFYALAGLIMLAVPRHFFRGVLVVSILTAATVLAAQWRGQSAALAGFFFDGRWLLFAVGVFVYYHLNYGKPQGSWLTPVGIGVVFLAAVFIRYRFLAYATLDEKAFAFEFIIATLFGLALLSLHRWDISISRSVIGRATAWCGRMCYSLYLIHWPVSKFLSALLFTHGIRGISATFAITMPICLISSLLASWGFYMLVERRFLNSAPVTAKGLGEENFHSGLSEIPIQQIHTADASA